MRKLNQLSLALSLLSALTLSACNDSDTAKDDSSSSGGSECVATDYTYDFNCSSSLGTLTLNTSETSNLTADATVVDQALDLTVSAEAGEKKLYLQAGAFDAVTQLSFKIKVSQAAYDAGFTGAKLYAKTGSSWDWNAGDWVSVNPDEWTQVTWTPGSDAVDLSEVQELGLQFYAGSESAAAAGVVLSVDDILIQ